MRAATVIGLFVLLTGPGVSSQIVAQERTRPLRNAVRDSHVASTSESSGLREVIDNKYKKRYQEWKDEFLSTDIGRAQWELYTHNPHLVLTITIASNNAHGAGTGMYKWNDSGERGGW